MAFLKKLCGSQKAHKAKKMSKESISSESTKCSEPAVESDLFQFQEEQAFPSQGSCRPCAGVPRKLFQHDENLKDKLVGVIVTIYEGESYDEMFREVRPTTVPGERISTYSLGITDIAQLNEYLSGSLAIPENEVEWQSLVDDVNTVDPDSVVFNWECCSNCGDHCFPCQNRNPGSSRRSLRSRLVPTRLQNEPQSETMEFMALALSRGHTVMCSDFSLKSLIYEWSEQHLGPNPFAKVGECDSQFQLEFVPQELQHADVPQQLQVVGELCREQGKAVVNAMGGTIMYALNPKRPRTGRYDVKILTVVTDVDGGLGHVQEAMQCSIGEGEKKKKGIAGHVTLTYPSGGQLVTSMGHWIELTRINTSLESVLRTAGHNFGAAEADDIRRELATLSSDSEIYDCVQRRAQKLVHQSIPSKMKCRTKF